MTDFPWLPAGSRFPDTRVSLLERLRSAEEPVRREAFGQLAAGYWRPVYKYLRLKWRQDATDAEDTTQAFLVAALEKDWFERYQPAKARFRTFLRVCLDRFVMNQQKSAVAQRRGGGQAQLTLDFAAAEVEVLRAEAPAGGDDDRIFRQEVLRDLFARALADVREECERTGKLVQFQVFERYDVDPREGVTYADLARELGLPATQVTNYLAAMRRLFRTRALEQLRAVSGSDAEYHAEARELFGVDVA